MAFDINKLTLGEVARIEEIAGQPVSLFADDAAPKGRLLIALAYVANRRHDPSYTLEQAEALTMPELQEVMGGDPDPKASPSPASKPAS
jgi:hypothetical protein